MNEIASQNGKNRADQLDTSLSDDDLLDSDSDPLYKVTKEDLRGEQIDLEEDGGGAHKRVNFAFSIVFTLRPKYMYKDCTVIFASCRANEI